MSVLDTFIIDVARDLGALPAATIAVHEDPTGGLFDAALATLATRPTAALDGVQHLYMSTPNLRQIRQARDHACYPETAPETAPRLVLRGLDTGLELGQVYRDWRGGTVLTRLPASIAGLEYLAAHVVGGGTRLIVGGNNKYLSRGYSAVLQRYFGRVQATRGRGKFRCLVADSGVGTDSRPVAEVGAVSARVEYRIPRAQTEYGNLCGVGGVFGGAKVDRGGELLGRWVAREAPVGARVLDLGCGNGLVALMLSRRVDLRVTATDIDADAVLSARATLAGVSRVCGEGAVGEGGVGEVFGIAEGDVGRGEDGAAVRWDDAGYGVEAGSFDVVALNPPFHRDSGIDDRLVLHLLGGARRALRVGGELYLVFNSHLRYRALLREWAHIEQLERNAKFTLLRVRKAGQSFRVFG